jgi:hypothetical protein
VPEVDTSIFVDANGCWATDVALIWRSVKVGGGARPSTLCKEQELSSTGFGVAQVLLRYRDSIIQQVVRVRVRVRWRYWGRRARAGMEESEFRAAWCCGQGVGRLLAKRNKAPRVGRRIGSARPLPLQFSGPKMCDVCCVWAWSSHEYSKRFEAWRETCHVPCFVGSFCLAVLSGAT